MYMNKQYVAASFLNKKMDYLNNVHTLTKVTHFRIIFFNKIVVRMDFLLLLYNHEIFIIFFA